MSCAGLPSSPLPTWSPILTTIAIDYTPAIRQQAGIGRIIRGQIKALVELNPGYDLRLFVVGHVTDSRPSAAPLPLHTTPSTSATWCGSGTGSNSPFPRVDWFTGGPLDLLHATDFVLPPSDARRKVLTVHDLAFLFYPDAAMPSLHRYLNVVVPRSVRRADGIIADSHHTTRDLIEQWQVPPERIVVVQGAVDHDLFRPVVDEQLAAGRAHALWDRRRSVHPGAEPAGTAQELCPPDRSL